MRSRIRRIPRLMAATAFTFLYASSLAHAQVRGAGGAVGAGGAPQTISAAAARQIQALLDEKAARTPTEAKISSSLLTTMKQRRGLRTAAVTASLRSTAALQRTLGRNGEVTVDVKGEIDKALINTIEKLGGQVLYATANKTTLRARLPIDRLDALADANEVRFIRPATLARTLSSLRPGHDFASRARRVREKLQVLLDQRSKLQEVPPTTNVGVATSQGDTAHGADRARTFFGVNGSGVKIGVLSDSVDFLANVQATGDLPPDVTVLPGQDGVGSGE